MLKNPAAVSGVGYWASMPRFDVTSVFTSDSPNDTNLPLFSRKCVSIINMGPLLLCAMAMVRPWRFILSVRVINMM